MLYSAVVPRVGKNGLSVELRRKVIPVLLRVVLEDRRSISSCGIDESKSVKVTRSARYLQNKVV